MLFSKAYYLQGCKKGVATGCHSFVILYPSCIIYYVQEIKNKQISISYIYHNIAAQCSRKLEKERLENENDWSKKRITFGNFYNKS